MEWNDNGMTRAEGVANGKGKRRRPTGRVAIATYRNNKRPNKRITKMFRQDQDGSADIEEKQRIQMYSTPRSQGLSGEDFMRRFDPDLQLGHCSLAIAAWPLQCQAIP